MINERLLFIFLRFIILLNPLYCIVREYFQSTLAHYLGIRLTHGLVKPIEEFYIFLVYSAARESVSRDRAFENT